ncbi:DUF2182 domain-containing protein [Pseudonocardia sp. KRD-169]|uniref:DUF2182 domain-containing protein n=1 Tax=Pseudonocardia abyssalis TaxID=2792008 RepID=A0ABS6V0T2_9PSEU|nr:DUF2182 domain-containing protein [Pseudonocardia abyssalis]MBW0138090.1 DUF2182 domain-containing protein [Pseudonocardia abyssalis]
MALAGAYRFVPMKLRCLEKCRTPRMFLFARWRGGRPPLDALRLGAAHGRFCVGCCWALMLVMLTAGLHSLLPTAGPAALVAVGKNASWGPGSANRWVSCSSAPRRWSWCSSTERPIRGPACTPCAGASATVVHWCFGAPLRRFRHA